MTEMTEEAPSQTTTEPTLEDRVRKLETALVEQQPPDENAIVERVIARLSAIAGEGRTPEASERVLVLDTTPAPLVTESPPPPTGAVLRPPEAPPEPTEKRWFVAELWTQFRLMFQMYFDPRYRISRTTQFVIPGIVLLLIFNYFLFSVWVNILILSPVAERVFAVLLGIIGYKLIVREIARYREVLAYLARYGQR